MSLICSVKNKECSSGHFSVFSSFLSLEAVLLFNKLRLEPIRFVRLDSEHAQSDGKPVNGRLPVLDLARGRDSWC